MFYFGNIVDRLFISTPWTHVCFFLDSYFTLFQFIVITLSLPFVVHWWICPCLSNFGINLEHQWIQNWVQLLEKTTLSKKMSDVIVIWRFLLFLVSILYNNFLYPMFEVRHRFDTLLIPSYRHTFYLIVMRIFLGNFWRLYYDFGIKRYHESKETQPSTYTFFI